MFFITVWISGGMGIFGSPFGTEAQPNIATNIAINMSIIINIFSQ
jgi:hypothetical protein